MLKDLEAGDLDGLPRAEQVALDTESVRSAGVSATAARARCLDPKRTQNDGQTLAKRARKAMISHASRGPGRQAALKMSCVSRTVCCLRMPALTLASAGLRTRRLWCNLVAAV